MITSPSRCRRLASALWLALAVFFACTQAFAQPGLYAGKPAKYVFFFIGDGMAIPQRTAAEYYMAAQQGSEKPGIVKLAMNSLPVQGATTTYSLNSIITDSGAAGTALACGVKTYNGAIGVNGDKSPMPNMAELAKSRGMKVGVVSSVSLDHATPACFYAHRASRNDYYEISLQVPASGFNYFAGGGFKDPEGKRSKAEGDKPSAFEVMKAKGYTVLNTRQAIMGLTKGADKIVAINPVLDHDKAMPYAMDAKDQDVSLAEFTTKGIDVLDNPKGFFMMVEGGKIDWACHANDAVAAIQDVLAFDSAVAQAVKFATKHADDTLIVVTGDHECGGLTLGFAGTRYGNYYQYLKNQTESYLAFTDAVNEYRKAHTPENASFDEVAALITKSFGLKFPSAADLEEMKKSPKPNEDVTSPADPYGMYLKPHELAMLQESFKRTMAGETEKSDDPDEYLRYGEYNPLAVTVTHVMDSKAGLGWTTYSHTGMPVMTSAMGLGAKSFAGYYDNTLLSKQIMAIIGSGKKLASNN